MTVTLRPYQQVGTDKLRAAYGRGAKAPLFVLATGGGKTICFSYITHSAAAKGKRVMIVAHREELIKQASSKLQDAGVSHGIIAPGWRRSDDAVQVASIQTVVNCLGTIGVFDLIVVDEGHHAIAGNYIKLIASQPKAKLLLVTATPERLDGRGLGLSVGGVCDEIIIGPSPAELIEDGYLSPIVVFAPKGGGPDMSDVGTEMGEFVKKGTKDKMSAPTITGDAVEHYLKHGKGQPFICFCVDVDHAHSVAATFKMAGVRAMAADGKMKADERDAAINGLQPGGAVEVLCVCDLVSEGLDIPGIVGIIILRPTKSLTNFLQWVGRAGRPVYAPGHDLSTQAGRLGAIAAGPKPRCIVLDHAGCTTIHGRPEAEREWSLLGRKKGEKAPATRQCPECFAIHAPAPECPECGWVYEIAEPGARGALELVAGTLVEQSMTPEWAGGLNIATCRGRDFDRMMAMADTRAKLQEIATARAYKKNWMKYQMLNLLRRSVRRGAPPPVTSLADYGDMPSHRYG